jgi:dihydroorotase-like cyclic amidohydrolase
MPPVLAGVRFLPGSHRRTLRGRRRRAAKIVGAPPLRSADDQAALWLASRSGDIYSEGVSSDADLVLFDPSRTTVVDERKLHSHAGYNPLHGFELTGMPVLTIARGEIVACEGELHSSAGRGRYVRRYRRPMVGA